MWKFQYLFDKMANKGTTQSDILRLYYALHVGGWISIHGQNIVSWWSCPWTWKMWNTHTRARNYVAYDGRKIWRANIKHLNIAIVMIIMNVFMASTWIYFAFHVRVSSWRANRQEQSSQPTRTRWNSSSSTTKQAIKIRKNGQRLVFLHLQHVPRKKVPFL